LQILCQVWQQGRGVLDKRRREPTMFDIATQPSTFEQFVLWLTELIDFKEDSSKNNEFKRLE